MFVCLFVFSPNEGKITGEMTLEIRLALSSLFLNSVCKFFLSLVTLESTFKTNCAEMPEPKIQLMFHMFRGNCIISTTRNLFIRNLKEVKNYQEIKQICSSSTEK